MILRRKPATVSLAAVTLAAGLCVSASAQTGGPPQQPTPNYRAIIVKHLRAKDTGATQGGITYFAERGGIFGPKAEIDHLEIADSIKMVQTNYFGWAWQTCVRLNLNGAPATFAVFIAEGQVVDARSAIVPDNCDRATYRAMRGGAALR